MCDMMFTTENTEGTEDLIYKSKADIIVCSFQVFEFSSFGDRGVLR